MYLSVCVLCVHVLVKVAKWNLIKPMHFIIIYDYVNRYNYIIRLSMLFCLF